MRIHILLSAIVLLTGSAAWGQQPVEAISDDDKYAPVDHIPEGYKIIEGDIVVPEDFDEAGTRATYGTSFWPNGIVPYVFDANVNATNRTRATTAMGDWEAVVNVDFRPFQAGNTNWLHIQNATFNASEGIGMAGGRHDIWIVSWTTRYTIAHEFGHALAYWHEQSRADRGTACNGGACIQVNLGNVCQTCCSGGSCNSQFAVRSSGDEYGPYDFDSVMHYSQCAFSNCGTNCNANPGTCCQNNLATCRTITVPPPNDVQWQGAIGQRTHLSRWDILVMSFLYPESNWRFVDRICQCSILGSCFQSGSFGCPYDDFAAGETSTPAGGRLWILRGGNYSAVGVHSKAMIIGAPLGGVVLGN